MASRAFIFALLSSSAIGDTFMGYGVLNAFETTVTTGVTVNSTAFGYVTALVDTAASTVTLSVGTTGITPTLAHIHGPGPAGVASGVLVPLNASNLNGTYVVTTSQVASLLAGKTYVNLHTSGQKYQRDQAYVNHHSARGATMQPTLAERSARSCSSTTTASPP